MLWQHVSDFLGLVAGLGSGIFHLFAPLGLMNGIKGIVHVHFQGINETGILMQLTFPVVNHLQAVLR